MNAQFVKRVNVKTDCIRTKSYASVVSTEKPKDKCHIFSIKNEDYPSLVSEKMANWLCSFICFC